MSEARDATADPPATVTVDPGAWSITVKGPGIEHSISTSGHPVLSTIIDALVGAGMPAQGIRDRLAQFLEEMLRDAAEAVGAVKGA